MVAMVAMVAIVAMVALVLVALVVVLFAPKVLRGMRSAAPEIGTRAGLIQACIEYCLRIRTGQGQDQPNHHRYDDRSDFHGDLPKRKRGSLMCWLTMIITSGSVNAPRQTAIPGH
jgi:hypothetical protein